jgi:hypothetical protein
MTEHQTSRTLVKSAPELWAECSDAASLARHLGAFGEIRITKLEPETAVAWEGAAVCGTVRLQPSGWGTRVTLTMTEAQVAAEPEIEPEPEIDLEVEARPEPEIDLEVEARPEPEIDLEVEARPEPEIDPEAEARPEPEIDPDAEARPETGSEPVPVRPGRLARLLLSLRRKPAAHAPANRQEVTPAPEPTGPAMPAVAPADAVTDPAFMSADDPAAVRRGEEALAAALDSLGRAHHRPYSRK